MIYTISRLNALSIASNKQPQASKKDTKKAAHINKSSNEQVSLEKLSPDMWEQIILNLYRNGGKNSIIKLAMTNKQIHEQLNQVFMNKKPQFTKNLKAWLHATNITDEEKQERQGVKNHILNAQFSDEDLDLGGCTNLTQLPIGLYIKGSLDLHDCTSLKQLPEWLSVGEDLNLGGCTNLTQLPVGLTVGGDLLLNHCTNLTQLPVGLTAGGDLCLSHCTNLTHLPVGVAVRGNLDLSYSTSLTQLPQGLSVGGNLNLIGCTNLTQLPLELSVRERLILTDPTILTQRPERLCLTGPLVLLYRTILKSLPTDPVIPVSKIYLRDSGIPPGIITRMRATNSRYIHFFS